MPNTYGSPIFADIFGPLSLGLTISRSIDFLLVMKSSRVCKTHLQRYTTVTDTYDQKLGSDIPSVLSSIQILTTAIVVILNDVIMHEHIPMHRIGPLKQSFQFYDFCICEI